jgi:predicted small lipoprotein YifL
MEPGVPTVRPTRMRTIALSFAALLLPLSLAACGSDGDSDDVASDPAPTSASPTPSPTESPTASPTVGTYPAFEPENYTFELNVSCFCMGAGVPIEVTVANAEVVGAVYGMDDSGRGGGKKGDPADESFWMTINDIINRANNTEADTVRVDWPAGQDYPNSVYVDGEKTMADDEVSYGIANVVVS